MPRQDTILISFRFGTQRWENMPFPAALGAIEKFLNAEEQAFIKLKTQISEDSWGVPAFWSEILGDASPPTEADWSSARRAIGRSRNAYEAGRDPEATQALGTSVHTFNVVHQKFWAYREALSVGGERAVTTIQITNMVLGAAFSAGVGVMGASTLAGATASAGLTLYQQTLFNAAMVHIGAQQRFDIAEIALQTGASFVSSVLSGVLCEKFATIVARLYFNSAAARGAVVELYYVRGLQQMTFDQIKQWAKQAGIALPLAHQMTSPKVFLAGLFASFGADRLLDVVTNVAKANKGKLMKLEELLVRIAERAFMLMPPPPVVSGAGAGFHTTFGHT